MIDKSDSKIIEQMTQLIDRKVEEAIEKDGHYIASLVAQDIINQLMEDDSKEELLTEYLLARAIATIRVEIVQRRTHYLGRARKLPGSMRSVFDQATKDFEKGDKEALKPFVGIFRSDFAINELNARRPLGEMTIEDHIWVASTHSEKSKTYAMEAAWHRAVAEKMRKAGAEMTKELWTEEEYWKMRSSFRY
jgi:hypothetical protein